MIPKSCPTCGLEWPVAKSGRTKSEGKLGHGAMAIQSQIEIRKSALTLLKSMAIAHGHGPWLVAHGPLAMVHSQ